MAVPSIATQDEQAQEPETWGKHIEVGEGGSAWLNVTTSSVWYTGQYYSVLATLTIDDLGDQEYVQIESIGSDFGFGSIYKWESNGRDVGEPFMTFYECNVTLPQVYRQPVAIQVTQTFHPTVTNLALELGQSFYETLQTAAEVSLKSVGKWWGFKVVDILFEWSASSTTSTEPAPDLTTGEVCTPITETITITETVGTATKTSTITVTEHIPFLTSYLLVFGLVLGFSLWKRHKTM